MGRKRKVVDLNDAADEEKATDGNSDAKSDLEKLQSHTDQNSQAIENVIVNKQIANGGKAETSSRAGMGSMVVRRRSTRLRNEASPSLEVNALVEHVNLVEDEREQEPEVEHASIPREMNGPSLEERVDCLVRAAADEYLKSKVGKGEDAVPCPDISYKSLYINAQKKIEALIAEHYELVRKLEFANGKIAAYEMMKGDSVLVSGLGSTADVAVNLSPRPVQKSTIPTPPAPSPEGANDLKPKRTCNKRVTWTNDLKPKRTYNKREHKGP